MLAAAPLHIQTKSCRTAEGARIAYHVLSAQGVSDAEARRLPIVVLANGLGGPYLAWKPLVAYLGDRYRFITWDYRGLYGSERPRDGGREAYAVERHVEDLFSILECEGVGEASLVGWSMGVQVCLEAYARKDRGVFRSLVLLNGTFGRPLDTVVPTPGAKHLVPSAVDLARKLHRPAGSVLRAFSKQASAIRWMKRVGAMGETLDEAAFGDLVQKFGTLDVEAFALNLRALGDHDASRILADIEAPVLVITGDRDRMTPRGLSQQMVRRLPRAEILVVRGGTHYTALEFPELVNLRIERFFREQGFA